MTLLGFLIMLKFTFIKTKFFTVVIGVIVSVIVYYINYFSSIFGANETLPIGLSIWLPHLILLLICTIVLVRINEF
jgi:lipopolysaccharide export system permease protein